MAASGSTKVQGLVEIHFPDVPSFNQRQGGYSALPWVFRSLLGTMNPRQWMLLSILYLRSGPQGLSWETDEDLGQDLAIGPKKVGPHLRKLQELGFVVAKRIGRRRYVMLVDPMVVAEQLLAEDSSLNATQRERLTEDLHIIQRSRTRLGRNVA